MTDLSLPGGLPGRIATEARAAGRHPLETGGFILAPSQGGTDVVLALSGQADIQRQKNLFHVGTMAIAALFDWTEEHGLTVAAQWHTHRRGAFLSDTDIAYGFNVPGFVTSVVPNYETASDNPADWGWWQFQADEWVPIPHPTVTRGSFSVITFEARHVRNA
jgi:hypothetical protein